MEPSDFAHLHVHSEYSLLDGAAGIEALVGRAADCGMRALALTDHGNLFGAMTFYKEARRRGINPILGSEIYVAEGSRFEKRRAEDAEEGGVRRKSIFHATLLARDAEGFANLRTLSTMGWVEGFYGRPRVDHDALAAHAQGLICLSGCLAGEIAQAILHGSPAEAETLACTYRDIFGRDNFFLEVMRGGIPEQDTVLEALRGLSGRTGIPLVATNDIHYVDHGDHVAQDVMLCIGTGKKLSDEDRFRIHTDKLYFRTGEEMIDLFRDLPAAAEATAEIASRCRVDVEFGKFLLPTFVPDTKETSRELFERICTENVRRLYPDRLDEAMARLRHEMGTIVAIGFVDYFLIVWDFIRYAREQGIPVGPGRGSAAGSIVAYALGITRVDPLRYDLLFERFLNSERISMPDIDVDFCKDGRERVIEYVNAKYGRDHVAQIITFGTMASKAVIRDVGRVLDIPLSDVDAITKKIPAGPDASLATAIEKDPEIRTLYHASDRNRQLFDIAVKLEGKPRHASVHPAGVVITDRPVAERVPLYRTGDSVTTQWTMDVLEDLGLLKIDFLGLRTLTILAGASANVKRTRGLDIDLDALPLDDEPTYRMLRQGDAAGVFQLESEGMKDLLRRLQPEGISDLIALLALYRPGPLNSGMVESYVRRRHGQEAVTFPHPLLRPILEETRGVILYQEQVMRIANVLSGFTLNESDSLRKAMGKKKPEILARFRQKFIEGAARNGVAAEKAAEIFDLIEYFAGYGFNKSHSTAYAMITYRTAYMKANFTIEFMAALLTCEMAVTEKVVEYIDACRALRIPVLPPDINRSESGFAVEGDAIRFALLAVKGAGDRAVEAVAAARGGRPFRSLFDVCERVDLRTVNRAVIEAFIAAGAFDSLHACRAALAASLDDALRSALVAQTDRRQGQMSLFPDAAPAADLSATVPEWSESEKLAREKAALGLYMSGHPLARHRELLARLGTATVATLSGLADNQPVALGGIIVSVKIRPIRTGASKGQKMAVLRFEDVTGVVEAVLFPEAYGRHADDLREDAIVFLRGVVSRRREEPGLVVEEVIDLSRARERLTTRLTLRLRAAGDGGGPDRLRSILRRYPGSVPVFIDLVTDRLGRVAIRAGDAFRVEVTEALLTDLAATLGPEAVRLN